VNIGDILEFADAKTPSSSFSEAMMNTNQLMMIELLYAYIFVVISENEIILSFVLPVGKRKYPILFTLHLPTIQP